jgi:hypothetical protein
MKIGAKKALIKKKKQKEKTYIPLYPTNENKLMFSENS